MGKEGPQSGVRASMDELSATICDRLVLGDVTMQKGPGRHTAGQKAGC